MKSVLIDYIASVLLEASARDRYKKRRAARSNTDSISAGIVSQPTPGIHDIICLKLTKRNTPTAYFVAAIDKSSDLYLAVQNEEFRGQSFKCLTLSSDDERFVSDVYRDSVFYRNAHLKPTSVVKQSIINSINGIDYVDKKISNPTWIPESLAAIENKFGFDDELKEKGYTGSTISDSSADAKIRRVGLPIKETMSAISHKTDADADSYLLNAAEANFVDKAVVGSNSAAAIELLESAWPKSWCMLIVIKTWVEYSGSGEYDDFINQIERYKDFPDEFSRDEFLENLRNIILEGYPAWSKDPAYKPEKFTGVVNSINTDLDRAIAINQGINQMMEHARRFISKMKEKLKEKAAAAQAEAARKAYLES
jgi:hypothetical protein